MYSGNVRRVSRQDIKVVTVSREMECNNSRTELIYAGGLDNYIRWLNGEKKPLSDVMGFRKEIKGITLDIALQWCLDGYTDTMIGYANSIRTIDGGTHFDGVKASITRTLNNFAKKSKVIEEKDITLSGEHVREGLTCIVSVTVPNPEFEGETQTRLGNQYVREIVEQSVGEYLKEYFELHPIVLERILSKSFNAYKTDLAIKKARVLFRSNSTPCTVLEKQTNNSSSKKSAILIGEGDSSSRAAAKPSPSNRLQSKRTREQTWKNDDVAVSTAHGESLENNSEKKRVKPTRSCVLTSQKCYASNRPPNHNKDDGAAKTPKDVARVPNKTRPCIPIGPRFQAEIPVWVAPTKKGKFYGSPGDSDTLRWLGTGVWPTYSLKKKVYHKKIGEGRRPDDSCSCASPGSTNCIKQHVKESRELLEKEIGRAFFTWEFDKIGEEAVLKSWTAKEELKFEALVKKDPLSKSEGFWEFASQAFPRKSKKDLLSYYHNVFLIKRMRTLANSSSASAPHIDSDDDHYDDFLAG